RLGGKRATDTLVGALYFQILNDPRIAHFFAKADVGVLLRHQKDFLSVAFGGDARYSGRIMRDAHRQLVEEQGLKDNHFDAMVEITGTVMADLGYGDSLIEPAIKRIELLRDAVLGRDDADTS
ncbi:MAG: group 1 truncated hemoglobin, partial [Pseudomonadota bacterium]